MVDGAWSVICSMVWRGMEGYGGVGGVGGSEGCEPRWGAHFKSRGKISTKGGALGHPAEITLITLLHRISGLRALLFPRPASPY